MDRGGVEGKKVDSEGDVLLLPRERVGVVWQAEGDREGTVNKKNANMTPAKRGKEKMAKTVFRGLLRGKGKYRECWKVTHKKTKQKKKNENNSSREKNVGTERLERK